MNCKHLIAGEILICKDRIQNGSGNEDSNINILFWALRYGARDQWDLFCAPGAPYAKKEKKFDFSVQLLY